MAEVLEKQIIQGTIDFEDDNQLQTKVAPGALAARRPRLGVGARGGLRYSTDEGVKLPIHASASMVRALAGLDIYLKEFCDRGGMLIIDEPEMNAHPEAQLKIIEFLALLAHHGVRVVLTTHSPYIVDHLSNLMQASQLSERAKQAIAPKFKIGMPDSFLSPEEVSAYLFTESGVVEDILDRKDGIIDLRTFRVRRNTWRTWSTRSGRPQDEEVRETVEQGNAV